jgi:hypothetical protein
LLTVTRVRNIWVVKRSQETLPKVMARRKPPIHGLWVPDERHLSALSSGGSLAA